ncbi:MAG: diacylglycerol/polyprenol kinase family protein [Bacteroidota bacterium]
MSERPAGDFTDAPPHTLQPRQPMSEQLEQSATIDYRSELIRKSIHLCSLSIPLIYSFISRELALQLLVPLTVAFIAVDLARYYHPPTAGLFYKLFGSLLRRHERDHQRKRLNGATNVLIGATLCVLVFPKLIVITAIAILIVSDSTSALIGRRYGRRRFLSKSLEGTVAFFITAVAVVFVTPKIEALPLEYVIGIVGAAAGAVVESAPLNVDDNISVPVSICGIMWALYALLLPSADLMRFA